jgi:putative hydrolase of the HAD superfamily
MAIGLEDGSASRNATLGTAGAIWPSADAQWLVAADRDGLESRERLAAMLGERFGLDSGAEAGLVAELRGGLVRQIIPDAAVTRALRDARAAGWVPFVVTNGTEEQQERKLRHTGLDREVAGWVISEGADISGARDAGLPGVWLHRGRPWPLTAFRPDHTADSFPRAVRIVLAAGG